MMKNIFEQVLKGLGGYCFDRRGAIALAFGVAFPVVVGSVGMALDLGQAYLVRQRLGAALDASALAGAAMETEEAAIRGKVEEFFEMNYPDYKIGEAYDLEVEVDGDDIIVSASADFDTNFIRVLGIKKFTVAEESIVVREVRGLEVVLVLDITGSMDEDLSPGYRRIDALKDAATSFVEILFDRTTDPDNIKIGLVPYSTSVNVGRYGIGQNPDGSAWEDGEDTGRGFVVDYSGNPITAATYTSNPDLSTTTRWFGCVVEKNDDGWDPAITTNDPNPNDVISLREAGVDGAPDVVDHEGPWPYYMYDRYGQSGSNCGYDTETYTERVCSGRPRVCRNETRTRDVARSCYYRYNPPSYNCPRSTVMPMTSDEEDLLASIDGYAPYGNTMGNIGMLWGHRLLSPEFPFQQGAAWGDSNWRKVLIVMTDGANTMDSHYSGLWRTRTHEIRQVNDDVGPYDLDDRFAQTCATAKSVNGILIYTITFDSGVTDRTRDVYRACATTPSQYYDAPTGAELIEVFESISRELANLHLRS